MRFKKHDYNTTLVQICCTPLFFTPFLVMAGNVEIKGDLKSTAYAYQTEERNGNTEDNLALVVTPNVTGIYDSKKVDIAINAAHTLVQQNDEEDGANKNFTDLKLNSNIDLIENFLRMNISGSQNYQVINSSQNLFSDKVLSSGDLSKIQRYSAMLNFSVPNPEYIGFDWSTNYSDTSVDASANENPGLDGNNFSASSRIYSAKYISMLTFDFGVNYNNTVRSNFSNFKSTVISGNVRLQLYDQLKLVLQGSDENYDADFETQSGGRTNLDSSSYGAGFAWLNKDNDGIELTYNRLEEANNTTEFVGVNINWAFSPRTTIDMNYGKRAYGDAYELNFKYQLKSFRSQLSYNEEITSYARMGATTNSFAIFVCSIGAADLSECFQPDSLNYVLQPGEEFKVYTGLTTDITNEVILTKAAKYVIGYDIKKLKVSFDIGYRETEYIESNRLQKYHTAGLNIDYRLTRRTNIGINTNAAHRESEQKNGSEDTVTVGFSVSRKLSRDASLNADIRYLDRSSDNENRDVTDKRLTVGFKYQF